MTDFNLPEKTDYAGVMKDLVTDDEGNLHYRTNLTKMQMKIIAKSYYIAEFMRYDNLKYQDIPLEFIETRIGIPDYEIIEEYKIFLMGKITETLAYLVEKLEISEDGLGRSQIMGKVVERYEQELAFEKMGQQQQGVMPK